MDASGGAYLYGLTYADNFPLVNPIQFSLKNVQDAFALKLNASGTALVYSTYLGGSGNLESGRGVAVDSAGNAYLTGDTNSADFPALGNTFQLTRRGGSDAAVGGGAGPGAGSTA